jgi:hypothetical protein
MDPIIDVLVETTQGSKHKYEYDHQRRAMRLDRRLYSAVSFPADYGFVAGTEGADGEPPGRPGAARGRHLSGLLGPGQSRRGVLDPL